MAREAVGRRDKDLLTDVSASVPCVWIDGPVLSLACSRVSPEWISHSDCVLSSPRGASLSPGDQVCVFLSVTATDPEPLEGDGHCPPGRRLGGRGGDLAIPRFCLVTPACVCAKATLPESWV